MARRKRGADETERTEVWYKQVNEMLHNAGVVDRCVAGRTLGRAIETTGKSLKKKKAIDSKTMQDLGTVEAWRWYQLGERTPGIGLRNAVDKLLMKLDQPPVGFIMCKPGEIELEPVWVWSPELSSFPESAKLALSKIEEKFWKRILPDDNNLLVSAVMAGVVDNILLNPEVEDGSEAEDGWDGHLLTWSWPKRLLVPSKVAKALPRSIDAPFSFLFEHPQEINDERDDISQKYTDKELINIFISWSHKSNFEDGEVWFYALRSLPGSPYYRPWAAADEMDLVTNIKFDHLVRDIKSFWRNVTK